MDGFEPLQNYPWMSLPLSVDVTNTREHIGDEVGQCYLHGLPSRAGDPPLAMAWGSLFDPVERARNGFLPALVFLIT